MAEPVALVTGASAGVGRAVSTALGEMGWTVGLVARGEADLRETAEHVTAVGGRGHVLPADVSDEAAVTAAVDHIGRVYGKIDGLILCAGIGINGPVRTFALSDWQRTIDTNLTGAFLAARAAIPYMTAASGASIIAISSGAGRTGYAGLAAYSASKFGLMGFMESLAEEMKDTGVRVSTIVPGSILTSFGGTPIDEKRALAKQGKGYLRPDDVARAVVYLLESPPHAWTQELHLWPAMPPNPQPD
jgi:NAD(P)-dependent dehydrogenase (short-subunit alcohol dehydrogenase family)